MVCNCVNFPDWSNDWITGSVLVGGCLRSEAICSCDISSCIIWIHFYVCLQVTSICHTFNDGSFVRRNPLWNRFLSSPIVSDGSFTQTTQVSYGCNAHTWTYSWSFDLPNLGTRSLPWLSSTMANFTLILYRIHSDWIFHLFKHTRKSSSLVENGQRRCSIWDAQITLWITKWRRTFSWFHRTETRQEEWIKWLLLCTLVDVEIQRGSKTILPGHTFAHWTTVVRNQCSILLFYQNFWRCWSWWVSVTNWINHNRIFECVDVTYFCARVEPVSNQITHDGKHFTVSNLSHLTNSQHLVTGKEGFLFHLF